LIEIQFGYKIVVGTVKQQQQQYKTHKRFLERINVNHLPTQTKVR
jgi:hypothetical protein